MRIENYKTTVSNITLPKSIEIKNRQVGTTLPTKNDNKEEVSEKIIDHTTNFDCVFWFGDLNFRSTNTRDRVTTKLKGITNNDYEHLLNQDELIQILTNGKNGNEISIFMLI